MAFTHYVDLMIREGAIAHDLYARLLLAVHYQNVSGAGLAVSWPDWKNNPGEFGLLCRVFGNKEDQLATYLETVNPLIAASLIRAFPIAPVPITERTVCFRRDRSHDKLSPSAARRLTARAAERGAVWASTHDGKPRNAGDHYLTIPSVSKKQTFRLYIRRDATDRADVAGSAYGLGYGLPDF